MYFSDSNNYKAPFSPQRKKKSLFLEMYSPLLYIYIFLKKTPPSRNETFKLQMGISEKGAFLKRGHFLKGGISKTGHFYKKCFFFEGPCTHF
jgi:hypothetical protein